MKFPGGFYFVLEGTEGSGKTTQYNLLFERLSSVYDVLKIREPGATEFGSKIRSLLLDSKHEDLDSMTELFLFSADRRHTVENIVRPALNQGKLVLSDRNYFSTIAYQGAGGNVGLENIEWASRLAVGDVSYDLAVILDIDPEIGLRRAKGASDIKDKIEARNMDYHKKVRQGYLDLAKRNENVFVVGASGGIEEIHNEIFQIAERRIDEVFKSS